MINKPFRRSTRRILADLGLKRFVRAISMALARGATAELPVIGEFLIDTAERARAINEQMKNEREDEIFERREIQQRLREVFTEFVGEFLRASEEGTPNRDRIVIFIDDLDRCTPDRVVRLLESLKLFLNVPNCVFVLGLDRAPIEAAIEKEYSWAKGSQTDYLDKIIQLQFTLPPVPLEARKAFVFSQLSKVFRDLPIADSPVQEAVTGLLAAGTGGNPRQMKRMISGFGLMHLLGSRLIQDYRAEVLALVLLLQQKSDVLFRTLSLQPERFQELFEENEDRQRGALYAAYAEGDVEFARVLVLAQGLKASDITPYIHLALPTDSSTHDHYLADVIRRHREWLQSDGKHGACAALDGMALTDVDLAHVDLSEASLRGASLRSVSLRQSALNGTNLSNSYVEDVDMSSAALVNSAFNSARLIRPNFEDAQLVHCRLDDADIRDGCFIGATLDECDFRRLQLYDPTFERALLTRIDGVESRSLHLARFDSARLFDVNWSTAGLKGSSWTSAVVHDCQFIRSDLREANFTKANLSEVDFSYAELVGARLESASVTRVDFERADLSKLVAPGLLCESVSFTKANMAEAKLQNSMLAGCDFTEAILVGADLTDADLSGANLSDATLVGARIEGALLHNALWNDGTIWPSQFPR